VRFSDRAASAAGCDPALKHELKSEWRNEMKAIKLRLVCIAIGTIVVTSAARASTSHFDGAKKATVDSVVATIAAEELIARLANDEKPLIIDVRGKDYDASDNKIAGAMRIPPADLKSHLESLPRDRMIITYCACGDDGGAIKAAQTLLQSGFKKVRVLKGGWNSWLQAGGPIEAK
jgi:rhodanese-related sulfurtransferase